jgi:glycosyltransferase involved in cell wall biosynthesis
VAAAGSGFIMFGDGVGTKPRNRAEAAGLHPTRTLLMPEPARQRKLLFYTPSLAGGGAERVWALLASAFCRRGYDVHFVMDFDLPDNVGYLDPGVRLTVLKGSHYATTLAVMRLLRDERPDVCFSAIGVANLKLTIAAILAGHLRHTVLSYHGYAMSEPRFLSRTSYVLTPLLTRLATRTVTVSLGLKRYMVAKRGAAARRTEMIYNPVLIDAVAAPTREALAARPPVVLGAGRLVDYKGFDTLIRAFAALNSHDSRLVIIGEGPERPRLEALVAELGLAERVSLPGYVAEPWRHYETARCFVLSSRTEAFGNVIVEALAAGLPIVSTDCHGPAEILVWGRYGAVVPVDDVGAMATAIGQALENPGDPRQRRDRAERFQVAHAVDEYERLVHDVLHEAT